MEFIFITFVTFAFLIGLMFLLDIALQMLYILFDMLVALIKEFKEDND